jgi:hypothetical protein
MAQNFHKLAELVVARQKKYHVCRNHREDLGGGTKANQASSHFGRFKGIFTGVNFLDAVGHSEEMNT